MSKLRSLNTAFWSDTWVEELSPQDKLLFIYLITNEKTNMLGIYEASYKKISFETGLTISEVKNGLKGFESVGKVKYVNNHVVLVNYMKHQNYNTNMKKSAIDIYNNLPNELKCSKLSVTKDNPLKGFESLLNHYGMVRKVEVEYEVETETEIEVEVEPKKDILYNIDKLINFYLSDNKLCNAFISNKENKIKDKQHLEKRLQEFKINLTEQGRHSETWKEFTTYFRNWNKLKKKTNNGSRPPKPVF